MVTGVWSLTREVRAKTPNLFHMVFSTAVAGPRVSHKFDENIIHEPWKINTRRGCFSQGST